MMAIAILRPSRLHASDHTIYNQPNMLNRVFLALVSVFWLQLSPALAQVDAGDGGVIIDPNKANVITISLSGSGAPLATEAFRLHGGFKVAPQGSFDFRIDAEGSAATLVISSGGTEQFRQSISGSSENVAILRAADLAVKATTGRPGFFAGKLAFMSKRSGHREIYTSNILFRGVQQLTSEKSKALLPHWSPDGTKLLYTSYHKSGFPDLFMIDLTNNKRTLFAGYRGTNAEGVFSPSGQFVAMILSSSGNSELYVGRVDGRTKPRRLTSNTSVESDPSWSADGKWLAVTSDVRGRPQIFSVPANGGLMKRIPTNISTYCTEPDWNPRDGRSLVFTAAVGTSFQLAVYDFDSGKSYFRTSGGGECSQPRWLNDGRHILYTRRDGSEHHLRLLDILTTHDVRLSPISFGHATQGDFVYP